MLEYARFIAFCLLLLLGILFEITAIFGVNRMRFSLNRLHSAAIGDTMGILFVSLACVVRCGASADIFKYLAIILIMWCTSPMSSHLISLLVFRTDPDVGAEAETWHI